MANPRFIRTVVFSLGLGLLTGNLAHAATTDWVGDQRAAVRLITATDGVTSDATLEAGLEFRFAKGWHGHWRTPGDAGIAPRMDWSGSENIARNEVPGRRRIASSSTTCRTPFTKAMSFFRSGCI